MRLKMEEIAAACNGRLLNKSDTLITSLCTDSRKIKPGCVFVALRGPNFDGHTYIKQAFENGAVCAVSDTPIETDMPLVIVSDTLQALQDIAAYYRRLFPQVKVVAITGSAGKTTTKDIIASVLSQRFNIKKNMGNLNNHIGVPLTLFQLEEGDEAIVVEMGMNHAGEIHALSLIAAPDIAVITNIGDAHIENFRNREGILHAKLEITDGLKKNGVLVVNGDDPLLYKHGKGIRCHIEPSLMESLGIAGTRYTISGQPVHIRLPGEHMVMNALLAAKVGEMLGLTTSQIIKGIETFTPSDNRMAFIQTHDMQIINDTYNANPAAMKAVIGSLKDFKGRKVCILGDMFELGSFAEELHKEVGRFAAKQGVILVAIGELARYMAEGYDELNKMRTEETMNAFHFADKNTFLTQWRNILRPGDTVLLKASHGMVFTDIIDFLRNSE